MAGCLSSTDETPTDGPATEETRTPTATRSPTDSPTPAGTTYLAENGQTDAVIVHHGHQEPGESLREYLEAITGATPTVVAEAPETDGPIVDLQTVESLSGTSDGRTADQAYRLVTEERRLHIRAQTTLGLEYGVYGLLQDHLGVGFYTPEYEFVPDRPTLALPDLDELQEPAFYLRNMMFQSGTREAGVGEYAKKNRHYRPDGSFVRSIHTFDREFDVGEHCPTDPSFAETLGEQFKERFAERDPDGLPLKVGQPDGNFVCECDDCVALAEEEGSYAAPMHLMLSRALDHAGEEYPDHEIITFAYNNTLEVPETIEPHENCWVNVVSSAYSRNMNGDQLGPIRDNPANEAYEQAIREWPAVAPGRVVTWHWGMNYMTTDYEWPNLFPHVDDIRLWAEAGVVGAQEQNRNATRGNWYALKHWVWAQIKWDPDQDVEPLVRRFLREYYGEAATPHLWEYLQTANAIRADSGVVGGVTRWAGWPLPLREKLLNEAVRERLDGLLADAHAGAKESDREAVASRVAEIRGKSIDPPAIDAARTSGGFAPTTDPRDDSAWYVAGGRSDVPARIERVERAVPTDRAAPEMELSWFYRRAGGRRYDLEGDTTTASVVPRKRCRIVDLVHDPTDTSVLAGEGYVENTNVKVTYWDEPSTADGTRVETSATLSDAHYTYEPDGTLDRTVVVDEDGLVVRRSGDPMKAVDAIWPVLVPDSDGASVRVHGAGTDEAFDGAEVLDPSEPVELDVADAEGTVTIEVDRGDGLRVTLETAAAGWNSVRLASGRRSDDDRPAWRGTERAEEYDWRIRPFRGGGMDAWPVDDRDHVRLELLGAGPDAALSDQRLTVASTGADGGEETVRAPSGSSGTPASPSPVTPDAQDPVALEDVGDGRAVNPRDGAELVWVPGGSFNRGTDDGFADERPAHPVDLDGFWIYRTPVTVEQYRRYASDAEQEFSADVGTWPYWVAEPAVDAGSYPVLRNWFDAQRYSRWAGGSLPSEAQWERAARGTDGRLYPWGDQWNHELVADHDPERRPLNIGMEHPGNYPEGASPVGALDMAGNVWEWVGDWYAPDAYERATTEQPVGPETGIFKVLRGGDVHWDRRLLRSTYRMPHPPHVDNWIMTGFRPVIDADADGKPR
jgi:formylglycine-generating enzyme required for sulfatase activity